MVSALIMAEKRLVPVLLVDDDDNDIVLFRRSLLHTGAAVQLITLSSGEAVMDYLSGNGSYADRHEHPLPQLVFLDAHLPQVPGARVLEFIKSRPDLAVVPVIILTGALSPADTLKLYQLGANAICLKPISPSQMDTFVSALCRFWIESTLPPPVRE
jgi:CheY-like chemotaxis protein